MNRLQQIESQKKIDQIFLIATGDFENLSNDAKFNAAVSAD